MAISVDPDRVMIQIGERFTFKDNKVEEPDSYLGAKLGTKLIGGTRLWTMSSENYINAALKNVETLLQGTMWRLGSTARTPMTQDFVPKLDGSPELDDGDVLRYRELIGILRWAVKIGRVDILHEVSLLSQYQAAPRQGHMEHLLHIFTYLQKKEKLSIYFDPQLQNINLSGVKSN